MILNNVKKLVLFFALIFMLNSEVLATTFDSNPSWPLCGRVTEVSTEVSGWEVGKNCPEARMQSEQYTDFPLSSTFGPRQLVSGNYRYDFHRGIDIATPIGTPIFAVSDGIVKKAGVDSSYAEPVVVIRHFKEGYTGTSCGKSGGCYHSLYLHMSKVITHKNAKVKKGDLIGYSGASQSGYAHLHFEIRKAPSNDPYSYWQRDSIHPLSILPYMNKANNDINISIENVSQFGTELEVKVKVSVPMNELDLQSISVKVKNKQTGQTIIQEGDNPNEKGYHVKPSWFHMEDTNREYTHKNSSKVSWDSFGEGGSNECPHHNDHFSNYEANIHMDKASEVDFKVGEFNGIQIAPEHYNANSSVYLTHYTFKNLLAASTDMDDSCIVLEITDTQGTSKSIDYNCNN